MSIAVLLDELAARRIELRVEDGQLRYRAPEGAFTAELRARVAALKPALLGHLAGLPLPEPELWRSAPSAAQQRLWFIHQLQGPNCTYNIPMALALRGALDPAALRSALDVLVRRHQTLRAAFRHDGTTLHWEIVRELRAPWTEHDFSGEPDGAFDRFAAGFARHCFALDEAPLFRTALVRLAPQEHVLLLNVHHIAADGWSFALIVQELAAGYEAALAGRASPLPALAWQYTDYVCWQERLRAQGVMDADLGYWRERLAGAPASTTLPADFPRPEVQDFAGDSVPLVVAPELTARLRETARRCGATLNQLTLTATGLLLSAAAHAQDLVIGLPLANRSRRELEPIIGMFVNVVPLRLQVAPEARLEQLLAEVKRASAGALEHGQLPFERLVEHITATRDTSRHPLFQTAYNFLPPLENRMQFGGLDAEFVDVFGAAPISKYDCTFYLDEKDGQLVGHLEYATSLYRRATAEGWARRLGAILEALANDVDTTVGALLASVSDHTAAAPAATLAGQEVPLPSGAPWARFASVASANPTAIAASDGAVSLTYAELAARAEALAGRLAEAGIGRGDRVGLLLPRGLPFVTAMLAAVHRGAAFVPLDPTQPAARLGRMAGQAQLAAVVCWAKEAAATSLAPVVIPFESPPSAVAGPPTAVEIGFDDPVYLIFTSGSTGVPKAVSVAWRGLCNFVQASTHRLGVTPGDRCSHLASPTFDASMLELWCPLLSGAALVVVPEAERLDPAALRDWLLRERIAVHFSPTPLAEELLALAWPAAAPLRVVITGGQALRRRPRPGLPFRFINAYGPTEASIGCTWGEVEAGPSARGLPSIGRPIDNTQLRIRGEDGTLLPAGEPGELLVSGVGLALGYFGDPALTAARFITLPGEAGRWYCTGDYVVLNPDGDLEFRGRADGQIKLRGHRIETGEIESQLLQHPDIQQAAVRLEGERLVAYVEAREHRPEPRAVRAHLAQVLPGYMLPERIVVLDRLPRQSSGKVDVRAIPPLAGPAAAITPAPAAPTGELLAAIGRAWSAVLNAPAPGPDENFFDVGGHSLLLVRLREQLRRETGRDIGILDLFRQPTIARQAGFFAGTAADVSPTPRTPSPVAAGAADGIAIIGMSGRFPDADTVEEFWQNLTTGRESITFFDDGELRAAGVPEELIADPEYVPANAVLSEIDRFDAAFFGVPAGEAQVMDPQQRLLLEEAWHTFEDAGYDPARITGRVGVFVGSSLNGYLIENVLPNRAVVEGLGGFAVMIQNDKDFAATRLSYKLGLTGPSVSVNTACSTSLVAVHQAVTALRDGQCELALAGGACVRSRQVDGYRYENGGVLSRDGHCRTFDAAASGMVGGNGVAVVLLKPLAAALADGDSIYAVIKGIAVNNDGANKIGFTAPGLQGQVAVFRDALQRAGVDPQTVGYIEAHGTATALGDTIEVSALAQVYAAAGERALPLRLGSVKSNIGHLDAAAGAAGLIKTALCLHHQTLVPSLHFQTPNPAIPWPGRSFEVVTGAQPWPQASHPARAAVSSLGIGGTNAHAVLEAIAPTPSAPDDGEPRLLLFSGRTDAALRANARIITTWCERHPDAPLPDVAHTLALGRRGFERRQSVCVARAAELGAAVAALGDPVPPASGVAFVFPGMAQHPPGMGRALYRRAPAFRACLDECADTLQPMIGVDIRRALLAEPADLAAATILTEHGTGQPALFAIEYALASFWRDLGLEPAVLLGHSLGEWVAATVAGVFALPDALRLVATRGRIMAEQPPGAMLAVNLTEPEIQPLLPGELELATLNAPDQMVVGGPAAAIEAFAARLETQQVRCKRLPTTVAAHSHRMDGALAPLRAAIETAPRHAPAAGMRLLSNATGTFADPVRLQDAEYWTQHLRSLVRFADEMAVIWNEPGLALLECGPSHALCNVGLRDPRRPDNRAIVASLDGGADADAEWRRVLATAGTLWAAGLPIDRTKLFALQGGGRRISLPGYQFQRQRHWLEPLSLTPDRVNGHSPAPSAAEEEQVTPAVPDVADASPTERRVMAVMRQLLGPAALRPDSDFFLLGGDSLTAVRLTSLLHDEFGADVNYSEITAARTPAGIAKLLEERRQPAARPDQADRCLVRLAVGDARRPPIVLVHAVGGGAFIYQELLGALALPNPVYGLQSPGLWDDVTPVAGLRNQAQLYFDALIRAGVRTPLMIGGSSYGGIVAYELDRLYQESGHRPAATVLFDSPGPGHLPRQLEDEAEVCAYLLTSDTANRDFDSEVARMAALSSTQRHERVLEQLRARWLPHARPVDVERLIGVFRQNLANLWDWSPQPHAARLLFCKAQEQLTLLAANPELAWVPLATAGIEIVPVPGDHSSMLSPPHVAHLAAELRHRLDVVDRRARTPFSSALSPTFTSL